MNLTSSKNESLILFLTELRKRLLFILFFLFILFGILLFFADALYALLAKPLLVFLPSKHLIATEIISPLFVPIKLAFMTALLLSAPFFIYQIWAFIKPALYGHERKKITPALILSVALFYLGILFAYFILLPLLFNFLARMVPSSVNLMPDIGTYLNFTTQLLLIFGGLFEIPIIMLTCAALNLTSYSSLQKKRRYALLTAFIIGMLIAPPDVLSQTLIAVPIYLLYELGLILIRVKYGKISRQKNQSQINSIS